MRDPLVGVFAKVERAEKHLDDFKDDWKRSGLPSNPVDAIKTEPYYEGGHVHFVAHVVAPTATQSVWIGEIIHDARSALDHLAHQLIFKYPQRIAALKTGISDREFLRTIQFPIFSAPKDFAENYKVKRLKTLLDPIEFAAIETSQPYKRNPTNPAADWMHVLSVLNNIDKHRTILMIDKRIRWSGNVGDWEYESIASVTETGADLFSMPVEADEADLKVDVKNPTEFIQFAGTGTVADGNSVVMFTRDLIRQLRYLVLNDFRPFFPTQ